MSLVGYRPWGHTESDTTKHRIAQLILRTRLVVWDCWTELLLAGVFRVQSEITVDYLIAQNSSSVSIPGDSIPGNLHFWSRKALNRSSPWGQLRFYHPEKDTTTLSGVVHRKQMQNIHAVSSGQFQHWLQLTIFPRVDNGCSAQGSFSFLIIYTHFDFKGRERDDVFISVNKPRRLYRWYSFLGPGCWAYWPQHDDVSKVLSVL